MSGKTLAVLVDSEGDRYSVTKWRSTGSRLPSKPKRPAKLYERTKGDGWTFLESWPACDGKSHYATLKDDREVLTEALKRLKISLGVSISEIVYDEYDGTELEEIESNRVVEAQ